jgi:hypothetical protein
MRRLFWLGMGVAVGALVVRRITKTAEAYTPKGLVAAAGRLTDTVREVASEIKTAMAEREEELLDSLGVSSPQPDQPDAPPGRHGR